MRIAARKTGLRPYMSPSLPYSGVDAVDASRYEVTTQERWLRPPRSPTIVGSAVETIVWSSAARNIPSIRAPKTVHSGRPVSRPFSAAATRPRTLGLDRALRGVLVRARDELIGRLLVGRGQRAGLHAEVHGLRVVGDDRHRRLLGLDREPAREAQADLRRVEEPEELLVLGLLRARGVAPRPPAALVGLDAQLGADLRVRPLGHALGGLHAEAVDEELLGELAVLLELRHELGDLVAGGHGLEGDDVELGGLARLVEVRDADPVVPGL